MSGALITARRRCRLLVMPGLVLALAACGHRIDDQGLLRANGGLAGPAAQPGSGLGGPVGTDGSDTGGDGPVGAPSGGTDGGPIEAPGAAGGSTGGTDGDEGTSATDETGTLTIGSVGNYSGPAGASLAPAAKGLQLWAAWVNDHGGVCGRRVQIVVVDDHSDPAQHRAALQDLVENRHVVSFSNMAATTGDAGVPYIESVRVPVIGTTGALASEFASPMYFLAGARNTDLVYATARTAAVLGPPSHRYGYLSCREVAACGASVDSAMQGPSGATAAGVEVVYQGQASIASPDYTTECQAARSAGAEVISVFLDSASLRRFGRSCQRQGYQPVYSGIAGTIDAGLATQPGFDTILVVVPLFPWVASATPAQREFHDAVAALYGAPADAAVAQGWTYGKMFEKAATIAARTTGTITSASLVDALHTLHDETFGGLTVPLTYPAGRPGTYPSCWFVAQAKDGTWTTGNDGQPMCR